jgi:hypothetical protein
LKKPAKAKDDQNSEKKEVKTLKRNKPEPTPPEKKSIKELSPRPDRPISYPENVTFYNWLDFMMVPTLVYDMHYPRTNRIRVGYLLEKIALIIGIVTFLHLISQYYIVPALIRSPDESAIEVCLLQSRFTNFLTGSGRTYCPILLLHHVNVLSYFRLHLQWVCGADLLCR